MSLDSCCVGCGCDISDHIKNSDPTVVKLKNKNFSSFILKAVNIVQTSNLENYQSVEMRKSLEKSYKIPQKKADMKSYIKKEIKRKNISLYLCSACEHQSTLKCCDKLTLKSLFNHASPRIQAFSQNVCGGNELVGLQVLTKNLSNVY